MTDLAKPPVFQFEGDGEPTVEELAAVKLLEEVFGRDDSEARRRAELLRRQPGEPLDEFLRRRREIVGSSTPPLTTALSTTTAAASPALQSASATEWETDLIPDVLSGERSIGQTEMDAVLARVDMVEAYNRWIGKMHCDPGNKRSNIMISCPLPGHEDKGPSADINLDKGDGGVWYCHKCCVGGDKYDIAAIRFGFNLATYKSQNFPELRRKMAEDLGWRLSPTTTSSPKSPSLASTPETNLPTEFWDARPSLRHIRQAAHARARGADAVLAAVMARVATLIPPTVQLPPIVAAAASLNFFTAIVAASGGGKSTSVDVAQDLVPIRDRPDVLDRVAPGSGEGLIEMYLSDDVGTDPVSTKTKRAKRQAKTAAFVFVDEGQTLLAMGERTASTVLPILRSAWSGATLGQQNAIAERNRRIEAHAYRMTVVVGVQLQYAAKLIADGEGGTPQRFVFLSAIDPTIPDEAPNWPGSLDLITFPSTPSVRYFEVAHEVAHGIRQRSLAALRGESELDPLDSHADLVRLKVAAVLAVMDGGRLNINGMDWKLAGDVMTASRAVRSMAIESERAKAKQNEEARVAAAVRRVSAGDDDAQARALRSGAKSIANKVAKDLVAKRSDLNKAVAGKHRHAATLDDMIDLALEKGWIVRDGKVYRPGRSRPT